MMFRTMILLLSTASLFGSACGGSKKKKAPAVQYFVHGDPNVLIVGTERSPSFLTPENATSFNNFHFAGSFGFIEQEPVAPPRTWEQVEADNSTEAPEEEIESEFELLRYEFRQESATRWVWGPQAGQAGYLFGFNVVDGRLDLVDYGGYPVTGQHYSLKTDGRSFSLLFSASDSRSGRIVAAFYFAATDVINPVETGSKDYAFLLDTVKIPWVGPIQIDTCGSYPEALNTTVTKSIDAWMIDAAPTATRRAVRHTVRTGYAPFSDLNQQCILPISNFKLENSLDFFTAGVTTPVFNLASKSLVDSDVMLFMDHYPVSSQMLSGEKSSVLTHELGHFFGLGHEFKRTEAGDALHPSIMGYSQGTAEVTSWDFEAIRDLYGESLGLVVP